jgi:hypothetical protein
MPQAGWVILPPLSRKSPAIPEAAAVATAEALEVEQSSRWESLAKASNGPGETVSWYLGGTLPDWTGTPLTVAVLLEEDNASLAQSIGLQMLQTGMLP